MQTETDREILEEAKIAEAQGALVQLAEVRDFQGLRAFFLSRRRQ